MSDLSSDRLETDDGLLSCDQAAVARRTNYLVVVVFFLFSIVMGLLSDGVHHDDDLTHFMFARWAWTYPSYLVHHWGRAGFSVPMAAVAWIGERDFAWHLGRALSAIFSAAAAWFAADCARHLGLRRPWLVVLLCYLQPLFAILSFTTLTENFLAFYLVTAAWFFLKKRPFTGSILFSLALLCRHEAVVLIPIWLWYVRPRTLSFFNESLLVITTCWAPIAQNIAHWISFGEWPVTAYFAPSGSTEYLPTGPLAYLPAVGYAASPVVVGLAIVGAKRLIRQGGGLIVGWAAIFLLTHIFVTWFGVFASGGFPRFMVAIAPLVAIAAGFGVEVTLHVFNRRDHSKERVGPLVMVLLVLLGFVFACWVEQGAGRLQIPRLPIAGIVACICLLLLIALLGRIAGESRHCFRKFADLVVISSLVGVTLLQWCLIIRPLQLRPEHLAVRDHACSIAVQFGENQPMLAANPWFAWYLGHIESPNSIKDFELLSEMPNESLLIWESIYSASDFHGFQLSKLNSEPGLNEISITGTVGGPIQIRTFRKTGAIEKPRQMSHYPRPMTIGRGRATWPFYELESSGPLCSKSQK